MVRRVGQALVHLRINFRSEFSRRRKLVSKNTTARFRFVFSRRIALCPVPTPRFDPPGTPTVQNRTYDSRFLDFSSNHSRRKNRRSSFVRVIDFHFVTPSIVSDHPAIIEHSRWNRYNRATCSSDRELESIESRPLNALSGPGYREDEPNRYSIRLVAPYPC